MAGHDRTNSINSRTDQCFLSNMNAWMKVINLTAVIILVGCARDTGLETKTLEVTPGMSAAEVRSILGAPQNRQFNGQKEAWQYCQTGIAPVDGSDKYVLVWITNNRVVGMQTYTNKQHGTCDSFFRNVKWEQAPDAIVEIRKR
jgi:hypothetical protein